MIGLMEMWILLGLIACGALVWYLYRSSQKDTDKNRKDQTDNADTVDPADDGYEDLLLTGLMLSEVYDEDKPPDDAGSDGFDSVDDSGGFDSGGFDGGGFDGGGFDGGGFE